MTCSMQDNYGQANVPENVAPSNFSSERVTGIEPAYPAWKAEPVAKFVQPSPLIESDFSDGSKWLLFLWAPYGRLGCQARS